MVTNGDLGVAGIGWVLSSETGGFEHVDGAGAVPTLLPRVSPIWICLHRTLADILTD